MSTDFRALLRSYLAGEVPQYAVRYWISFNLDEPPDDIVPLVYDVALIMWEVDDGYGDEDHFRAVVAELLAEEPETEKLASAPGGDA